MFGNRLVNSAILGTAWYLSKTSFAPPFQMERQHVCDTNAEIWRRFFHKTTNIDKEIYQFLRELWASSSSRPCPWPVWVNSFKPENDFVFRKCCDLLEYEWALCEKRTILDDDILCLESHVRFHNLGPSQGLVDFKRQKARHVKPLSLWHHSDAQTSILQSSRSWQRTVSKHTNGAGNVSVQDARVQDW